MNSQRAPNPDLAAARDVRHFTTMFAGEIERMHGLIALVERMTTTARASAQRRQHVRDRLQALSTELANLEMRFGTQARELPEAIRAHSRFRDSGAAIAEMRLRVNGLLTDHLG